MFRQARKMLFGGIPFISGSSEKTATEIEMEKRLAEFDAAAPDAGWDRVKYMLFGVKYTTLTSIIAGGAYGGVKTGQKCHDDFIRTNQATAFDSHMEAKRRLSDKIFVGFMKGAAKLAWRTGLFGFMFMTVTNSVAIYRNKDGILEYILGGAAAGMTYRFHLGLKGITVGGILGGALGTFGGTVCYGLFSLTGYSMTNVRQAHYAFSQSQKRAWQAIDDEASRDNVFLLSETPEVWKRIQQDEIAGKTYDKLDSIEMESQKLVVEETNVNETKDPKQIKET